MTPNYFDLLNTDDLELTSDSMEVTFSSYFETSSVNATEQCVDIAIINDGVIENEESFRVELSLKTLIPTSQRSKLRIASSTSRIIIEDRSTYEIMVLSKYTVLI